MSAWVDNMRRWLAAQIYTVRTVVPGLIDSITNESGRERDADFQPGIGDLVAGQTQTQDITPGAPVLTLAGGGYFVGLPSLPGDEVLGLASDRPMGPWRDSKTPGQADPIVGKGGKSLTDVALAPFTMTAPSGAPDSWDGLTIGGPAGPALELDDAGAITITKQGVPVATLEMDSGGSVTISVEAGQSVNLGGALAVALTQWAALSSAMTALLSAGAGAVGSPGDPAGENAGVAFGIAQGAWEFAIAGNSPAAQKAKGE